MDTLKNRNMKGLFIRMRRRKWPIREQAEFLKKAGELLQRGYHLSDAIQSLAYQFPDSRQADIHFFLRELKNGSPFHKVLGDLGFNRELAGYVYFAEQHGDFAAAVLEGSTILLGRERDARKLAQLMYYPILLFAFTMFMLVFVQKYLLPRFDSLFDSMGLQTNFFAAAVSSVGNLLPAAGFILSSAALAALGAYQYWFKKIPILEQRSLLIKIPFAGRLLKILHTHYFSIQLGYLLTGGMSVYEALSFFEANKDQEFYSSAGRLIMDQLASGDPLETILGSLPFFEKELPMVVRHGQENGRLGEELQFYSRHCLSRLETAIGTLTRFIQPGIFLFIGILIVSIYLAILLPMFQLLEGI